MEAAKAFDINEKDSADLQDAKQLLSDLRIEREKHQAAMEAEGQDDAASEQTRMARAELEPRIRRAKARVLSLRVPGLRSRKETYEDLLHITALDLDATQRELQTLAT